MLILFVFTSFTFTSFTISLFTCKLSLLLALSAVCSNGFKLRLIMITIGAFTLSTFTLFNYALFVPTSITFSPFMCCSIEFGL